MAYLDDIIITSINIEEGLERLECVLEILRQAGLTIRLSKCCFLKRRIDYLGFEITAEGIAPGRRKIVAVQNFPVPINVREVRSFIGLASYFRRFVKNFAFITRALTNLLKKDNTFEWGREQQEAFDHIKDKLIKGPILSVYNPNAITEVHTDACSMGLGGVLLQKQSDGKLHPISYYSHKTTQEESRYHSYELEALAIVCTLERFRVYLLGIKFTIRTDCNSLKLLATKRDLKPRVGRCFVRLAEFNYVIEYHKGESNTIADALSRWVKRLRRKSRDYPC